MTSHSFLRGGFAFLLLTAIPGGSVRAEKGAGGADAAALRAASALYEGIRAEILPNGLQIFLKPIPGSPVVTTMVAYKVGSADEDEGATGLSHYLEHLMFKGTDRIRPGDIDRMTLRNGGANNAYTSEDCTIYHFDFAADRWEAALDIEADRMRNLRIDDRHEFQQEKGAVIEELERNEDTPWDLEEKTILPVLFGKTAPYGHPVIGERQHVRGATAEVIKGHYDRWYHPNNAALVICGGFDPDHALALVREKFGNISRGKLPPRKAATSVKRAGPVRLDFTSKFEVPRLLIGFNTIRATDPDYYALEVVQGILTTGKTARLYKSMVEGSEIAGGVSSGDSVGRYPGSFLVQVELLKGKELAKAEELVLGELRRLRDEPVTTTELQRVKREVLASAIFDRESVHSLADSIARGVTIANLAWVRNYLPGIAAVSAEDVQRVAQKYFNPEQRVVVRSSPHPEGGQHSGAEALPNQPRGANRTSPRDEGGVDLSLAGARRVVLDNGLTLLLYEKRQLPIFVANAFVRDVRLVEPADKEGLATLMGRLLDEGTPRHTGPQIAEMIENVGGSLSLESNGGSVRVLSPDRSLGLGLLIECLSEATFPKEAFNREKNRLVSEILDNEKRPEYRAQTRYRALLYGKHPYGRPSLGVAKTVEPLQASDCAAFHRQVFAPGRITLAVVGDFDSNEVIEEIKRLTTSWKAEPSAQASAPPVVPPTRFVQQVLTMPQAAQLHFYLGSPGIRRDDPDYYKLMVMDYVLGTGPGFTDRLSSRLRDRQGLAYTVSANITSSAGEQPGLFTCYIGTRPDYFKRVKEAFLEELSRIREQRPSVEEVEDAKKYLLGSLPFQLTTSDRIASQLIQAERFHLGFNYLETYRKAVAAVTPEEVQEVARKHLDPARMVLVAAGALDQNGRPLEASHQTKPGTKE